MYDRLTKLPTFPKMRLAMGGRHVPSVWAWFERYESGMVQSAEQTEGDWAERWEGATRKRGRGAVKKEGE